MEYILENNTKTGIDPYLILSIIKAESNFDPKATSNKNAKGLMQILDTTTGDVLHVINYDSLDDIDLYDPKCNIEVGINYFNLLVKRYDGNYYLAICAYNAGIGNVDLWIKEGILDENLNTSNISTPYKETNNYLRKVISNYNMYRMLY